jgi:ParB family transcriptional regulator, chromosome partitioning protein
MNRTENPRKVLGKGLNALLSSRTQAPPTAPPMPIEAQPGEDTLFVPIDSIDPNPLQPRRVFQEDKLAELAQSIRANGIVQPLVVRRTGDRYQLVAGERRWRAARIAGLARVPVVVRDIPDDRLLEITLIENIQREDLNPIETAVAFDRLGQELNLTAEQVGQRTGKDRSTVLNFTRLLQLPPDLQEMVGDRRLSHGHARSLLALPTLELQREVATRAVANGWSVRETERTTQKMILEGGKKTKHVDEVHVDPNVKAAVQELERALGTKVRIFEKAKRGGRIEIDYYSQEDLDRIYGIIVGES